MSVNEDFLEAYDKAIDEKLIGATSKQQDQLHAESALCKMLRRYVEDIPDISSDRFHKTFRQNDVVDQEVSGTDKGGLLDMVIWNLLYPCNLFWEVRHEFLQKKEPAQTDGSD